MSFAMGEGNAAEPCPDVSGCADLGSAGSRAGGLKARAGMAANGKPPTASPSPSETPSSTPTWAHSPRVCKALAGGGLFWTASEVFAVSTLLAAVVRWEALLGRHTDHLKSGIPAFEQAAWNMQKLLRCVLFVLCFSSAFLRHLPRKARSWPSLVFAHVARELWLFSNGETEAFLWRRRLCFILIASIHGVLGTVRSFAHLRTNHLLPPEQRPTAADGDGIPATGESICSSAAIGWIIFLLDVVSNCGFLLGFLAGRAYFATAAHFAETQYRALDPAKEAFLRNAKSSRDCMEHWWTTSMKRPLPAPQRRDVAVGTSDDDKTEIKEESASPDSVGGGGGNGLRKVQLPPISPTRHITLSPKRGSMGGETPSRRSWSCSCDWNQLEDMFQERGPVFWDYARIAMIGLSVASIMECYFLRYWEVGILGGREDEVDVFHQPVPYFMPEQPDFSKWKLKRVVLGSWRDVIYLAIVHPMPCAAVLGAVLCLDRLAARRRWRLLRSALHRLGIGALSFVVFVSAHRAYFALLCLLICWECRVLEIKALRFARAWTDLDPRQRWQWHAEIGSEIKALDERLAPLISYVFLHRLTYLALDLARRSCESSLPFNLVHYFFRHVMFLIALSITFWRIGKLNFSYYEKLQNSVLDAYPHNWADCGTPGVTQNEIILQRNHIEDWRHYLAQQIDSGRREACVCVLQVRWAAKWHVLALSILTIITLPLLNKAMDTYGKTVVNERLLSSSPAPVDPWPFAAISAIKRNMCSAETTGVPTSGATSFAPAPAA